MQQKKNICVNEKGKTIKAEINKVHTKKEKLG